MRKLGALETFKSDYLYNGMNSFETWTEAMVNYAL